MATSATAKVKSWQTELRLLRAKMDRRPNQIGSPKRRRQLLREAELRSLIDEAKRDEQQEAEKAAVSA